jgi:fibronectin-binding autotransporter adhesin
VVNRNVTINSGATVNLGVSNALNTTYNPVLTVNTGGTFGMGANSQTLSGLAGAGSVTSSAGAAMTVNATSDQTFSGAISGATTLTKSGAARLTLSGSNSFSGATSITGGTLAVSAANALANTASMNVTGGTLLLGGSGERVNNSASATLSNGRIAFDAVSNQTENLGALTLTGASVLDFGTGSGDTLRFASLASFTGTLQIWNWTGTTYGIGQLDPGVATQDRLIFDVTTGLNPTALAQISFFSGAGTGFLGTGAEIAYGASDFQIVPVPEPGTIGGAAALVALAFWRERRRWHTRMKRERNGLL